MYPKASFVTAVFTGFTNTKNNKVMRETCSKKAVQVLDVRFKSWYHFNQLIITIQRITFKAVLKYMYIEYKVPENIEIVSEFAFRKWHFRVSAEKQEQSIRPH